MLCVCRRYVFGVQSYFESNESSPGGIPLSPLTSVPTNQSDDTSIEQHLPRPLQVYHRHQRPPQPPPIELNPAFTFVDLPPSDFHLLIAFQKSTRFSTVYPISTFVSYNRLHLSFRYFGLSIFAKTIPRNYQVALLHPQWKIVMDEEMQALVSRGT